MSPTPDRPAGTDLPTLGTVLAPATPEPTASPSPSASPVDQVALGGDHGLRVLESNAPPGLLETIVGGVTGFFFGS